MIAYLTWMKFSLECNNIVIGLTGCENRKVINNYPKYGITVVFVISADGSFCKPIVITKGYTNKYSKNANVINGNLILTYTDTGWIDYDTMVLILMNINTTTNGQQSVLILDTYSTHKTQEIIAFAEALNIELIFVPPGKTPDHQPLDVGINGPIKSIAKGIIKELYLTDPFCKMTFEDALNALAKAVQMIKKDTIIKAFKDALLIQP